MATTRTAAAAATLAAAGLVLGGCGGADDPPAAQSAHARPAAARYDAADLRLARASMVRQGDFPPDWAADAGSRREHCRRGGTFAGLTAYGASAAFTHGNVNIQQSVWVFRDEAAARRAFAAMNARDGRACFRLQVTARIRDQDSELIEPLRTVHQRHRKGARRTLLVGRISRIVDGPLGPTQTDMSVKVDEIERRDGRGITTIAVVAAAEKPNPYLVDGLADAARDRLGEAIGTAGS